jgi:hypothetical protein
MDLGHLMERGVRAVRGSQAWGGHPGAGGPDRTRWGGFGGNPYGIFGGRPVREARLRSYIIRQHRLGRTLDDVLADPYVARCGSPSLCWRVVAQPETISALAADDRDAIRRQVELLAGLGAGAPWSRDAGPSSRGRHASSPSPRRPDG